MRVRKLSVSLAAALTAIALWGGAPARANETDQFLLPPRGQFADLGWYLTKVHYDVLDAVVQRTNAQILAAGRISLPAEREKVLATLHSPLTIIRGVRAAFGPGFFEMIALEASLRTPQAAATAPGSVLAHRDLGWIYWDVHLPIDPRKVVLLMQSSTICAYGVHFGVDKMGHLHDLGNIYYGNYLARRRAGQSEDEAVRGMVAEFSRGPISESAAIGLIATGVVSNGDLAANYAGYKFYRNITESVAIGGETLEPMVVIANGLWRLNFHVRPDSDFVRPFITDHLNEALNPSQFQWGMRGTIAQKVKKNREKILAFYADENGTPREREWFVAKAHELTTFHGEDYGHTGLTEGMMLIPTCCFGDEEAGGAVAARTAAKRD